MTRLPRQPADIRQQDGDTIIAMAFDRAELVRLLASDNTLQLVTPGGIVELRLSDGGLA